MRIAETQVIATETMPRRQKPSKTRASQFPHNLTPQCSQWNVTVLVRRWHPLQIWFPIALPRGFGAFFFPLVELVVKRLQDDAEFGGGSGFVAVMLVEDA